MPGWYWGNPLCIMIEHVSGSGVRWTESYAINAAFATRTSTNGATPAIEFYAANLHPPPPPFPPSPPPAMPRSANYMAFHVSGNSNVGEEHVNNGGNMCKRKSPIRYASAREMWHA